jgi:hypothetical protein
MSQIVVRPANFEQLGYTSDHVRRDINVTFNGLVRKGFTWNLQERCYSKKDGPWGYANNPLNCTEDENQYEKRKIRQINEIVKICQLKDSDFGLLQEVDFCFPEYYRQKDPKEKIPEWLPATLEIIKDYFSNELTKINFAYISYEPKELVIIYRLDRLKFIRSDDYLTYTNNWETKSVLFLGSFEDNDQNIVKFGTLHGNYNVDYSLSIPELLRYLKMENNCVIIGGDTNHPPGYQMSGLLVLDENETTNFFTNYADVNDQYTQVHLEDPRCHLPKAYDGFFVTSGDVEISGSHVWTKKSTETNEEYPVLIETTITRKITV